MKTLAWLIPLFIGQSIFGQNTPLRIADHVDLERYSGTWYEIARLPNRFQRSCVGDVSATYTLLDNDQIRVVNRCRMRDGTFREAEGRARRAGENEPNSKLKVRFAPSFLSFLPFVWGDYWIIDLDPEYRYAVVGHPGRKYLWILAREPKMEDATLVEILNRTRDQGYNITEVIRTKHQTD